MTFTPATDLTIPTRAAGDPDPSGDVNKIKAAVAELRGAGLALSTDVPLVIVSDTRPASPAVGLVRIGAAVGGGGDTTAPTAPSSLAAGTPTSTTIPITWVASTDAVGVTGYNVYNNGTLLQGGLTGTSATISGLTASTSYTLTLKAYDAASNLSAASNAVTVSTTAAAGAGTSPSAVTGLAGWYKADALSLSNAAAVATWPTSQAGGTNMDLVQSTGTKQPVYFTGVQNGLPVVRFDGTKVMQTIAQSPSISTTSTIFLAGRFITATGNATMFDGAGSSNCMRLYLNDTTHIQYFAGGGTAAYAMTGMTSWHIFGVRHNGTTAGGLDLWVDGVKVGTGTGGSNAPAGIFLGAQDSAPTVPANADIGEVAVYPATVLSDADMLGVSRNLGARWGVTVA